ncbi:MAG: hypothetical protein MZU97_16380 [Bacillus subtilis]|nr:hypothetical protein [Bacillus subtilis]
MNDKQIIEQLLDRNNVGKRYDLIDDFNDDVRNGFSWERFPCTASSTPCLILLKIDGRSRRRRRCRLGHSRIGLRSRERTSITSTTVEDDALFDEVIAAYEALE